MKTIFIDKLNFFSFIKIFFTLNNVREVKIISELNYLSRVFIWILNFFKIKVNYENFFFGNIKGSNGESIFLSTRKIASIKSLDYSSWVLENSSFNIKGENNIEGKRILQLNISKTVWSEMEYFYRRLMYIKTCYDSKIKHSILLSRPIFIKPEFLINNNKDLQLFFYGNNFFSNFKILLKFYSVKLIGIKNILGSQKNIQMKKSTVSISTDNIDINSSNRFFPHWYKKMDERNLYILNHKKFDVNISENEMKKNNIKILNSKMTFFSSFNNLKIKLTNKKNIPIALKIKIKNLFAFANGSYVLLKKLNCDQFIFIDTNDPITDAVTLISKKMDVKTSCIQFSNMGIINPLMMTITDIFFSFSSIYEKIFSWNKIKPKSFEHVGYSFNSTIDQGLNEIKNELDNIGVETTIVYFDESVENNKWGLISEKKNISDLELLAKTVIRQKNIAIILKPQFFNNSVNKYNSKILNEAIQTKRFIEIKKGKGFNRNLYTPSNLSQIADYAIGNLVGATASLEFALNNKKSVLINPYGYKSENEIFFNKSNIVFKTLGEAIKKIISADQTVGDWSKVINHFSKNTEFSNESINSILSK
tara:strand:+ start:20545 stop:22317 length:1773 start_codon:yes stop_codon:yes gene_type:complete